MPLNPFRQTPHGGADVTRAEQYAYVGSLALIALIMAFDIATGPPTNVSGAVAVAPFLAATLCSVRRTLTVAFVAVIAGVTLLVMNATSLEQSYGRIFALAFALVVAPLAAAARERRERRIADLTRVAEVAQRALLTPPPPVVGPVEVAARYHSASREALVGGDLYAVAETDGGVRLLLGDVRGKGVGSVAQAGAVLTTFRELAGTAATLITLTRAMEDRLSHVLHGEDFVTAALVEIDDGGGVQLVSCGHPPPVVFHDGGHELVELDDYAAPFGLGPQPAAQRVSLRKGERLLLYTDGLTETRTASGEFISLDDILTGAPGDDLGATLDSVLDRIDTLSGEIRDDLALLLVEFHGRPAIPGEA